MYEGDFLQSPNGLFGIYLDSNGDLVEKAYPDLVWDAHTSGTPDSYLRLQLDGNLVFHDGLGNVVGISGTQNYPGDVLRVQDDGNVVIYQSGNPLWSTQTAGVEAGLYLTPGQSVFSPNGNFQLNLTDIELNLTGPHAVDWVADSTDFPIEAILQTDGNFVLYGHAHADGSANPVWASNTAGNFYDRLWVQDDGNVVLYGGGGHPLWSSGTVGAESDPLSGLYLTPGESDYSLDSLGYRLTLQTDGNLVEYGLFGNVVWASGTNGQPVIEAILQTDGNLVLYGPNHVDGSANPIWASNTDGNEGATLSVEGDGVWIYDAWGNPIWINGNPPPVY
jgi:hypothetical protein